MRRGLALLLPSFLEALVFAGEIGSESVDVVENAFDPEGRKSNGRFTRQDRQTYWLFVFRSRRGRKRSSIEDGDDEMRRNVPQSIN